MTGRSPLLDIYQNLATKPCCAPLKFDELHHRECAVRRVKQGTMPTFHILSCSECCFSKSSTHSTPFYLQHSLVLQREKSSYLNMASVGANDPRFISSSDLLFRATGFYINNAEAKICRNIRQPPKKGGSTGYDRSELVSVRFAGSGWRGSKSQIDVFPLRQIT